MSHTVEVLELKEVDEFGFWMLYLTLRTPCLHPEGSAVLSLS